MKVWYHVLAALVGLAVAALIVWFVFGNASQEGATQEGSAGSLSAEGAALCGTVTPAEANSAGTRRTAGENLPGLADAQGPIPSLGPKDQVAWVGRVHAAAGLCIDELKIEEHQITITMSTVEGVDDAEASAFAAGALAQAFTPPLNRPSVTLTATVDGSDRTVVVSRRAWDAFRIYREAGGLPLTMGSLVRFRTTTSFGARDLRVVGWR